jgi:hypothetical protein
MFKQSALLCSLLLLCGCSSGDGKNADVMGKVTYNGAPVPAGTVQLVPLQGGSPQVLVIGPDGAFHVGVVPLGEYKVAIETESVKDMFNRMFPAQAGPMDPAQLPAEMRAQVPVYVPIPPQYADPNTSGLSWDLKNATEKKNFELQ